jgi:septal ring factor EnvC (AmiA/AmiB activator)
MSSTEWSVIIGTISAAFASGFTLAATKGIEAWLKYRADQRIDKEVQMHKEEAEQQKEDNTLRFLIGRQDARIEALEKELRELHSQHNDCEKKHEALKVRLEILETKK